MEAATELTSLPSPTLRPPDSDLLELDDALARLAAANPPAAELVKLKFFAGITLHEAGAALGLLPRSADRMWAFARAWLIDALDPE